MKQLRTALLLSCALVGLLLVASLGGLAYGKDVLYAADPATLPTFLGQDALSLAVGIPLLAAVMFRAWKGSIRAVLAWAGILLYFAYSYFFYVVGAQFSVLFLVYVGIVGTSLYGFLSLLFHIDREELRRRLHPMAPAGGVSAYLLGVAFVFVVLWTALIVSRLADGRDLEPVARYVIAIDGAVALPLLVFTGTSLMHRHAWGYTLAPVMLVKMGGLGVTLVANTILLAKWGQRVDPLQTVIYVAMAIASLTLAARFLRMLPVRRVEARPA